MTILVRIAALLGRIGKSEADILLKASTTHAATHITGGSDQIDADQLDIDFTPNRYTPSTSPGEASNVDHLTAHLAGIDDGLITYGTDVPSTPSDGDLFFDTADHILYSYDSTRSKWLGTAMEAYYFGRNGTFGNNTFLKGPGAVVLDGSPGQWLPFDYTIVGYSWHCQTAPGESGSNLSVRRIAAELTNFDIANGTAGRQAEDQTLDIDFNTDGDLNCRVEDLAATTCTNAFLILYLRRRTAADE